MTALIFDTEQTGLPKSDPEIIEAAWIWLGLNDSEQITLDPLEEFEQRYKPSKPSTFGALAVHHILPHELDDCPPSSEFALPECNYLIGHSIDFDWQAAGSPDIKRIDTYAMAQHVWPDADGYSQSALIYMLLGPNEGTRTLLRDAHHALTDCRLNLILLGHLYQAITRQAPHPTTWEELWAFSEECRIPLRMPITNARGEKLTDIDDGLLAWCLNQYWMPEEHPYLYKGLLRECERRQQGTYRDVEQDQDEEFDDNLPF